MAKEGKKQRKFGRHRDRSPSAKMYKLAKRWEINAKKRAKRHARRTAKKTIHRILYDARVLGRNLTQDEADKVVQARKELAQLH